MMEPEAEHEPAPQVGDEANINHTEMEPEDTPVSTVVEALERAAEEQERQREDQTKAEGAGQDEVEEPIPALKSDKPVLTTNTETLQVPRIDGR